MTPLTDRLERLLAAPRQQLARLQAQAALEPEPDPDPLPPYGELDPEQVGRLLVSTAMQGEASYRRIRGWPERAL